MKKQFFVLACVMCAGVIMAQIGDDPVIMKINGKDVKKSEFEYIYKKNQPKDAAMDQNSLQEYIELFKNFKLKVAEAETQGLDTTAAFYKEFNEYRTQSAKPYLTDLPINEKLVQQEYDRLKEYVEFNNILISIPLRKDTAEVLSFKNVIPADTVASYKKATQALKQLSKQEDFVKVAQEYSDDMMSLKAPQPAYMGWFSALRFPATLEDAMYQTPVGEHSGLVRTPFGYHLIQVLNRKNDPGQIHASHILLMCPMDAEPDSVFRVEQRINNIYNRIMGGEDFAELAKAESDDKGSGSRGGDLSWFGMGAMVKEFQDTAFALENIGDVSKPVRSQFGFHIIKLLGKKDFAPLEEKRNEIISRLSRMDRAMELKEPTITKLKEENGYILKESAYRLLENAAMRTFPSDSSFLAEFADNDEILFISGPTPYKISDFIRFLNKNSRSVYTLSTDYLKERFMSFELEALQEVENNILETKYPEFGHLMREYRDGILLFEVSNNEVWEKASRDTEGLSRYFDENRENYNWDTPHYKGYVLHFKDEKTKKILLKEIAKMPVDSAAVYLSKQDSKEVTVDKRGLFVEGDNSIIDEVVFKTSKASVDSSPNLPVYGVIGTLLTKGPEDYTDIRGLVITDYQNYLEQKWLEELNSKYSVVIDQDVVQTIK